MNLKALGALAAVAMILGVAGAPASAATIPGDVSGDCNVNSTDVMLVASRYGATYGSLRYVAAYDLNNDRRISAIDIQMVAAWFGTTCA